MSLLRQRQKNLLLAGLTGMLITLVILLLVYLFVMRGNVAVIKWLLEDSQVEVSTHKEVPEKEVMEKVSVYTLLQGIEKDNTIARENILRMEVDANLVPEFAVLDINNLIGKKIVFAIEGKTILTKGMIREPNVEEVFTDLVEISELHIPSAINEGDFINIRISFPSGQDFLVLEGKEVKIMDIERKFLYINLFEEEILNYSSAIVDQTIYPGTKLYITEQTSESVLVEPLIGNNHWSSFVYERYPLNPNVSDLSASGTDNLGMHSHRIKLDISLFEYFDQDGIYYRYGFEELTDEELALEATYLQAEQLARQALVEELGNQEQSDSEELEGQAGQEEQTGQTGQAGQSEVTESEASNNQMTQGDDEEEVTEEVPVEDGGFDF